MHARYCTCSAHREPPASGKGRAHLTSQHRHTTLFRPVTEEATGDFWKGVVVSASLSPYPNLEQLRKQAKDLHRAHADGQSGAVQRLKAHVRRLADLSEKEILSCELALREAQHAVACESGYADWQELRQAVAQRDEPPKLRQLLVSAVEYSDEELVPVQIHRVDMRRRPEGHVLAYVLLKGDADRVVTICCGQQEGQALSLILEGRSLPRPLTHDLLDTCLQHLDCSVRSLVVHSLQDTTFLAHVSLETPKGVTVVDCRPSDGLILAARWGAPIYGTRGLVNQTGRPMAEVLEFVAQLEPAE